LRVDKLHNSDDWRRTAAAVPPLTTVSAVMQNHTADWTGLTDWPRASLNRPVYRQQQQQQQLFTSDMHHSTALYTL